MSDLYHSRLDMIDTIMMQAFILAQLRSKDPRCRVGAAVYDPVATDCYFGYNGFPAGVADTKQRWDNRDKTVAHGKHGLVRHAEANAIDKAQRALGADILRCALVVTHFPCHRCIVDHVSSAGIRQVFHSLNDPIDQVSVELCKELGIALHHRPITNDMRQAVRDAIEVHYED